MGGGELLVFRGVQAPAGRDATQETGWRLMRNSEAGLPPPLPLALSEGFL